MMKEYKFQKLYKMKADATVMCMQEIKKRMSKGLPHLQTLGESHDRKLTDHAYFIITPQKPERQKGRRCGEELGE